MYSRELLYRPSSNFHPSKSKTSQQAYLDFKFHLSHGEITSIQPQIPPPKVEHPLIAESHPFLLLQKHTPPPYCKNSPLPLLQKPPPSAYCRNTPLYHIAKSHLLQKGTPLHHIAKTHP